MKIEQLTKKKLIIIIVTGILLSIFSFLFYNISKSNNKYMLFVIYVIDMAFCLFESYILASSYEKSVIKTLLISFLFIVAYFSVFIIIYVLITTNSNQTFTIEEFFNIIRVALFLSPSIMVILPLIMLICYAYGN